MDNIRKTRFRLFFFPRNHFQRRPPYLSPLSSFRPRKAHPIWQLIARMRSTETEMGNSKMGKTEMENTRKNAAPAIADGCTLRALFKIFVHRQIGQMHFSIRSTQPCSDNCDNHEDAANDIMKLEIRWCERTDIMMVIIMMMISSFRSSHHPHTLHCSALDGYNDNDETDDCEYGDLYKMGAVCLCVCYVFSYFFS